MTFAEAYEDACFSATAEYLTQQEHKSKEYQILDEESQRIYEKIEKELSDKDLLDCYDRLENAKGEFYLRWTYQKACYDFTFLLKKMGIIFPDSEIQGNDMEEIFVLREHYEMLSCMAARYNISVDLLASKFLKYILDHSEEVMGVL